MNEPEIKSCPLTKEQLEEVIQDAWDEHIADTGCFPDCLELEAGNKHTTIAASFKGSEFMREVWELIQHRTRDAEPGRDVLKLAKEALKKYGSHSSRCSYYSAAFFKPICSCGFEAALTQLEKEGV